MKLYLIRHQERGNNPAFYTPLTIKGDKLSEVETCPQLNECNITQIFSSPFYRVLQTLEPYLKQSNKKVKIEYALYEVIGLSMFNENNYKNVVNLDWIERFHIDESYESLINKDDLVYPENIDIIKNRVEKFINWLLEKYYNTDEVILIASHQYIIHVFIEYFGKKIPHKGVKMGELTQLL